MYNCINIEKVMPLVILEAVSALNVVFYNTKVLLLRHLRVSREQTTF